MITKSCGKELKLDRRTLNLVLASFLAAPTALAGLSRPLQAQTTVDAAAALAPRFLGSEDAPLTMIEYFSLTCGACGKFHRDVLPTLKEKYIDTGKLRMEYRDFPLDIWALRAAAMARSAPQKRYDALITVLFDQQARWTRADDVLAALKQIGRLAGLSSNYVQAALMNTELLDGIANSRLVANRDLGVQSTPTFLIGDRKLNGFLPLDEFDALLAEMTN
jgi:protein-disulfide isomerase|tara:strand:+ start:394 stop:1053 length:660 start_codon:yes stop_codon:yes gene_type:complete